MMLVERHGDDALTDQVEREDMGIMMFTPAPIPSDDFARSRAALSSALMTSPQVPRLANLAKEARSTFRSRWSGICVIAEDWQHVVASSGGMLGFYRRSTALSSYVVAYPDRPFYLLDAAEDERFAGNPFVDDQLIRFYAGAPIRHGEHVIGAVCVTDPTPRSMVEQLQLDQLQAIASRISQTCNLPIS
jgi:GAF domain-containing protein